MKTPRTELFEDLYGDRSFTTKAIDGRSVELVAGGRKVFLRLDNARRFVQLMTDYHLREFDLQCAAIARGVATMVSQSVTHSLTQAVIHSFRQAGR